MKLSYNWLQSFFNPPSLKLRPSADEVAFGRQSRRTSKKLPAPEKLAEILTMHSFETEVQSPKILDIDILPNRAPDCLSHLGIARECSALLNINLEQLQKIPFGAAPKTTVPIKVELKAKNLCSRYCARLVTNVKVGPSPKWLQERLEDCGVRAINNIVDVTNYVMLEFGQPLHAFDADKVQKHIIIRRAKKGERIVTLDGQKRDLDENILVIADAQKPIALAGVMGGVNTEVSQQTTKIILESANFNPTIIRRASQKFNLRTESSIRFEYGLDANLADQAINRAASLIEELAQGKAVPGIIDIYPKKVRPKKITLEIGKVQRLLGVDIPIKEIKRVLENLGFELQVTSYKLQVTVPTWRLDISIPEDLIEEIGRIYGYQKIPAQFPATTLIPAQRHDALIYENKTRDILTGLGFTEVYNYSFISQKDIRVYPLFDQPKSAVIELENPISQEQKYLRPNLLLNLLRNVKNNLRFFNEIKLFEVGRVFSLLKCHPEGGRQRRPTEGSRRRQLATGFFANAQNDIGYGEEKRLTVVFALKEKSKEAREFYRLKGVTDSLLNKLGLSDIWYDDAIPEIELKDETKIYHPARRAQIKIGDDLLGIIGEINPEILKKLEIKSRVAALEINLEKLTQLATEERIYQPPSKYPAMVRDIAILVEQGTKVVEVLNLINAAGGKLVCDVDLFDIYEGEEIPEGKKNLAFHIIYQADDHTLTDKEVDKVHNKIIRILEREKGWEVRK